MALNDPFELDPTSAVSNSNFGGANTAEGCAPSGINNAIRYLGTMLALATSYQSSPISSSVSTNIAATGTGYYMAITGANAINSFGTVPGARPGANPFRILEFSSSASLSHGSSLILLGGASRKTQPGDVGMYIHEGSGSVWREVMFQRASGSPLSLNFSSDAAGTLVTVTSTEAGAATGPDFDLFRDSATPAISDFLGSLLFTGRDSGGNKTTYASITTLASAVTDGAESGRLRFTTVQAGASANRFNLDAGLYAQGVTGSDKGAGTVNATGLYVGGHGTIAQTVVSSSTTADSTGTAIALDNSIPQITEGKEYLTATITPINASSTLRITISAMVANSASGTVTGALFVDATANALYATGTAVTSSNPVQMQFTFTLSAGSTSARTYRFRFGPSTGTAYITQGQATALYGGVATSTMTVEEILPQ